MASSDSGTTRPCHAPSWCIGQNPRRACTTLGVTFGVYRAVDEHSAEESVSKCNLRLHRDPLDRAWAFVSTHEQDAPGTRLRRLWAVPCSVKKNRKAASRVIQAKDGPAWPLVCTDFSHCR